MKPLCMVNRLANKIPMVRNFHNRKGKRLPQDRKNYTKFNIIKLAGLHNKTRHIFLLSLSSTFLLSFSCYAAHASSSIDFYISQVRRAN